MKKIFLFIGICGLLLGCEENGVKPETGLPGTYDVTSSGKINLTYDKDRDSINLPEAMKPEYINISPRSYSGLNIKKFIDKSIIIEFPLQQAFTATSDNSTFSYQKAPFNMNLGLFELIGTRTGNGEQQTKNEIVMRETVEGDFIIIYDSGNDTITGTFNGRLQHFAVRKPVETK